MSVMSEIDASARQVDRILDEIIRHAAQIEHHKQKMQKLRDDLRSLVISNYTPATIRVSELFSKEEE